MLIERSVRYFQTTQDNIPEQYESLFKRREGFTYHYVQINYVKGCKFGLGIKHFQNNVIVSRIDPGFISILNYCCRQL